MSEVKKVVVLFLLFYVAYAAGVSTKYLDGWLLWVVPFAAGIYMVVCSWKLAKRIV